MAHRWKSHGLAGAVAASLLSINALPAVGAASDVTTPQVPAGFTEIAEWVAPGVHLIRQAEPFQPSPLGNVTVIEQADGLVVVDAGGNRGSGLRIVSLIRSISPKPVKAVVITHWHNDHPLGLGAIIEAWPQAEVISTVAARDGMAERLANIPRTQSDAFDETQRQAMRDAATQFTGLAGDPEITAEERRGWEELARISVFEEFQEPGTYVVMPTRTFTDTLTIEDPERPLEVVFLGRANTNGDAMVWLPRQKVFVAGDAVVSPVPFMFQMYPLEAIAVLERIKAYDFEVMIPGHGFVHRDKTYLDRLIGLIADIRAQVAPLATEGLTPAETTARVNRDAHHQAFVGGDPWRRYWLDRYTLTPLISSAYSEAKGEPMGPRPRAQ